MRPGLVIAGGLIVTLAAGAFVSLVVVPPPGASRTVSVTGPPVRFFANSSGLTPGLPLVDSSTASIRVSWQSSVPLRVALGATFYSSSCSPLGPNCSIEVLAIWPHNATGIWSFTGPVSGKMYLAWTSGGGSAGLMTYGLTETTAGTVTLPPLTAIIVDSALLSLAIVGVLALFLGLFLRGGVYREPRRFVSRSAEDATDLAGSTDQARSGPEEATGPKMG